MTVVFAQGMRRSGTTILFDLLWDDGRFSCFYEPLNRIRPARGGGSRARDVDYMERVTEFRARFLRERHPDLTQEDLNWGAPRAPALELEPGWPPHVREFVAATASSATDVFVKFTRASHKVPDLAAIRPDAYFVHLVRDPRAVATSHLFRTAPEHRERILREGSFFTLTTGYDQWRAEEMARLLVAARPTCAPFAEEPGFAKVMLLWRELYLRTRDDARRSFPGRHALVRHEALCADPERVLRALYRLWGSAPEPHVLAWARENVRPAKPWHDPGNRAWAAAMERLGLGPLVEECEAESLR